MTVVAIIGILAAIAIPNYITYQLRAKTAEAIITLETIAYLEQVQILEYGDALACEPSPPEVPSNFGRAFVVTDSWSELGFEAIGPVRFQYEVRRSAPRSFVVLARADLDGDGELSHFELSSETMQLVSRRPTE